MSPDPRKNPPGADDSADRDPAHSPADPPSTPVPPAAAGGNPVGAAVGAVAGAAAGFIGGIAAGPVGSLAGVVAGGVAGAAAGSSGLGKAGGLMPDAQKGLPDEQLGAAGAGPRQEGALEDKARGGDNRTGGTAAEHAGGSPAPAGSPHP